MRIAIIKPLSCAHGDTMLSNAVEITENLP
jgi:hypothetical protein